MTEKQNPYAALHLLIALCASGMLVWGARYASDRVLTRVWPTEVVSRPALAVGSFQEDGSAAAARKLRVQQEQERQEAERLRREQQRDALLRARDEEVAAIKLEEERKQAAWVRFYRKPKKCDAPPDQRALVECSNHFLREQERFEKAYAEGKL